MTLGHPRPGVASGGSGPAGGAWRPEALRSGQHSGFSRQRVPALPLPLNSGKSSYDPDFPGWVSTRPPAASRVTVKVPVLRPG